MAMSLSQARKIRRVVTTERPFDLPSPEEIRARLNEAAKQGESVSQSKGVTSENKGSHFADQRESKGVIFQTDSPNKGSQSSNQGESLHETKGVTSPENELAAPLDQQEARSKGVTYDEKSEVTLFDPQSDSPSLSNCLPLIEQVTPLDGLIKGSQLASDSLSSDNRLPLQRESLGDRKGSHLRARRTVGGLRLKTLAYLLQNQEQSGLAHTTRLKREDIAKAVQTTEKTLRAIIKRLESDSFLVRQGSLGGRGESGIVFRVTSDGEKALKGSHLVAPKGVKQGESVPTLVSSSDLKTTTTNRDRADQFQDACERFELLQFKIDGNVLLEAWRKGAYDSEDDLLLCAERLAFHLNMPELSKGLTNPRAWFAKKLEQGAFAAPVGFKSWAERQAEAMLVAKRAQLARLEELRRQALDADFEIWFHELGADEKRRRLRGMVSDDEINSRRARMLIRDEFLKERGHESA